MLRFLDILRIVIVCLAFFIGYSIGFAKAYDPIVQLHFMIPVIITAIAGLSGLEGLFFGEEAAALKGYETGSNYQLQSAIAMLSYAVISLVVWFCDWGIRAEHQPPVHCCTFDSGIDLPGCDDIEKYGILTESVSCNIKSYP